MEQESPKALNVKKSRLELTPEKKTLARKRWELLINVLTQKGGRVDRRVSVRRFASFGLLQTEVEDADTESITNSLTGRTVQRRHIWYKYTCPGVSYTASVRHLDGSLDISDVLGFNNTGNVCVWPSEEILTYYCLNNAHLFRNKRICELGGGMTCLAGLAVAQSAEAAEVLLTDGNDNSIDNVKLIVERNSAGFGSTEVCARVLRWDDLPADLSDKFDYIICADCLFFDEYRQDLLNAIQKLLKPQGMVLIFAPSRGETFQEFENLVDDRFENLTHKENYDNRIWTLHEQNLQKGLEFYDPNLHYPMMLSFSKAETSS